MCCAHSFPLSPLSYLHHSLRTCSACEEDNSKFIISIKSTLITSVHRQGRACTRSSRHSSETVLPAPWSVFPVRTLKTMVGYSFTPSSHFLSKIGCSDSMLLSVLSKVLGRDKEQDSHFPNAPASAPARCAVALGEHGCCFVCCLQAVKPQ